MKRLVNSVCCVGSWLVAAGMAASLRRASTSAESTRFLNAQYEELKGILAGLGLAR